MPIRNFANKVMETTTTTGTGTLTLAGAVTGHQSAAAIGDGNVSRWTVYEVDGNGVPSGAWETFIGTYTASGTTLSRTEVLDSSNGGAAVNFGVGTKRVICAITPDLIEPGVVILGSDNVTLDPASAHPNGTTLVRDSTSIVTIKLPTLANQPNPGHWNRLYGFDSTYFYQPITFYFAKNDTNLFASGSVGYALLEYLGSDIWVCTVGSSTAFTVNVDA